MLHQRQLAGGDDATLQGVEPAFAARVLDEHVYVRRRILAAPHLYLDARILQLLGRQQAAGSVEVAVPERVEQVLARFARRDRQRCWPAARPAAMAAISAASSISTPQ